MISAPSINPDKHNGEDDNKVCEGFDCQNKATKQLDIPCGKYGSILVFLCNGCAGKIR